MIVRPPAAWSNETLMQLADPFAMHPLRQSRYNFCNFCT
jgi:hypothetical protein